MNDIVFRLHQLDAAKQNMPSVGGQMAGLEQYRLVASGNTFAVLYEAGEEIQRLENALHRVIDAADIQAARRIAVDVVGTSEVHRKGHG